MIDTYMAELVEYALDKGLIEKDDRAWAANRLLAGRQAFLRFVESVR